MKKIAAALSLIFITMSCSHFDFHMARNEFNRRPEKILIAGFTPRNMSFDPFVSQNFQDTLSFELFKIGYRPLILSRSRINNNENLSIKALCEAHGADLYMTGSLSEKESGDLLDRDISTLVTFHVYNREGVKCIEARYSSTDSLSDVDELRSIAGIFIGRLDSEMRSAAE